VERADWEGRAGVELLERERNEICIAKSYRLPRPPYLRLVSSRTLVPALSFSEDSERRAIHVSTYPHEREGGRGELVVLMELGIP